MDNKERIWFCVAIVLSACCTVLLMSSLVTDPGHMLIVLGGDAGMTYHSYLYHILYEKGTWTQCMNYPYGDNITYKGGIPLLSIPLGYLKSIFSISSNRALAVFHLSIAFGCFLAILYTYKTLYFFKVRPLLSVLFACLIICLSPQLFRVFGHFGLAYLCVIPMLFYWSLKYYDNSRWRYPAYIWLLGSAMCFIHLYFGGLIFIWIVLYIIGHMLFVKGDLITKMKHNGVLFLAIAGTYAVVKIFLLFTDPITDRPAYSSGALMHATEWKYMIYSPISPLWTFARTKPWWFMKNSGEGNVYLGVAVILVLIISLIVGLIRLYKDKSTILVSENKFQPIWLFIAIGAMLFAMGIPFIWHLEWLFDYLSVFRQFRALGRFSWIFYYIISVYCAYVVNSWYEITVSRKRYVLAYSILVLPFSLWGYEAYIYINYMQQHLSTGRESYDFFFSKNEQNWNQFLAEHGRNKNDYQALLLLPYTNVGSEKLSLENEASSWVTTLGGKASIQLHLPIVNSFVARASLSQAENQVRTVAGPFADKPLFKQAGPKPFLLLHSDCDSLDQDSKYLMESSDFIGQFGGFYVYSCYPDRVNDNDRKNADSVNAILPFLGNGDTCVACIDPWYVNHFDSGGAKEMIFGSGAQSCIASHDSVVAVIPVSPGAFGKQYEFSAWFLVDKHNAYSPAMYLQLFDSSENITSSNFLISKKSNDNYGLWIRCNGYFKVPTGCKKIHCKLMNDFKQSYLAMDELLFRPANALVISRSKNNIIMVNNHVQKAK